MRLIRNNAAGEPVPLAGGWQQETRSRLARVNRGKYTVKIADPRFLVFSLLTLVLMAMREIAVAVA
jgi:hypothetical protein